MNKSIVWIDNDKKSMDLWEQTFNNYGFDIVKCETSIKAIDYLDSGDCKNILLDVDFPNSPKEGMLLSKYFQKHADDLNIVILTGFPETTDAVKAVKEYGVKDYIEKPIPSGGKPQIEFFKKLDTHYNEPSNKIKPETDTNKNRFNLWNIILIALLATYLFVLFRFIMPYIEFKGSAINDFIFYSLFIVLSLIASIVLFGFLNSTGFLKTKNYQFGGAAAFFIVLFGILINTYTKNNNSEETINGIVFYHDKPLVNCNIKILELEKSRQTNEFGSFQFNIGELNDLEEYHFVITHEEFQIDTTIIVFEKQFDNINLHIP